MEATGVESDEQQPAAACEDEEFLPATQLTQEDSQEFSSSPPPKIEPHWGRLTRTGSYEVVLLKKSKYTIGRSEKCDFHHTSLRVSGIHCTISFQDGTDTKRAFITDSSANGTWINQMQLKRGAKWLLASGDKIRIALNKKTSAASVEYTFVLRVDELQNESHKPELAASGITQLYLVEPKPLGVGAYGVVHAAYHRGSGERFAIKIINKSRYYVSNVNNRNLNIMQEVQVLKSVRHKSITRFKGFVQTRKYIYLVMEYVGGGELLDRIQSKGCYSEKNAAQLLYNLLEAVSYLHGRGIVHRDLKPENILLTSTDSDTDIKLTDFGVAKVVGDEGLQTFCGTPLYFAPEVLERKHTVAGAGRYGKAVDMWSLGVISYILLCGFPPFHGSDSDLQERRKIDFDQKPWPSISFAAKDFVSRLLCHKSSKRMDAQQAMAHPWIQMLSVPSLPDDSEVATGDSNTSTSRAASSTLSASSKSSKHITTTHGHTKRKRGLRAADILSENKRTRGESKREE